MAIQNTSSAQRCPMLGAKSGLASKVVAAQREPMRR
jgi:hypothetical protein